MTFKEEMENNDFKPDTSRYASLHVLCLSYLEIRVWCMYLSICLQRIKEVGIKNVSTKNESSICMGT